MIGARGYAIFGLIALVVVVVSVRLVGAPSFTDAFYHFNAASRFASGHGLTDTYIWTYIGIPDQLGADGTIPSHLYWMPMASVIAGISMSLFGAPGDHGVAQLPFIPMLATVGMVGFWLGGQLSGTRGGAWIAGLLTLFNGFFVRYWGAIETFTPYAFFGSLALVAAGVGLRAQIAGSRRRLLWLIVGAMCAGGHLTRNDGLLLVGVAGLLIIVVGVRPRTWRWGMLAGLLLVVGYGIVMTPLFLRNLDAVGSPLPFGGTQAIWFTEYNELFNFPPDANPQRLMTVGIWESRRDAVVNNALTFIAVEGLVVMTPFMLIGLWRRRRDPLLWPFGLYAVGLHAAMTLVFPFPGYRGGLFHSAAALIPFWSVLGVIGVDTVVDWAARRRRWRSSQAKWVFGGGLVVLALILTISIARRGAVAPTTPESLPALYRTLSDQLPPTARLLINDPAQLYYFTGLGGAVLPNADPSAILSIAERYAITHVLLELDGQGIPAAPTPLLTLVDDPPDFLEAVPLVDPSARLYVIRR